MYKYIKNYVAYYEKYHITDSEYIPASKVEVEEYLNRQRPLVFFPKSLEELTLFTGLQALELGFLHFNKTENQMWKRYVEETLKKESPFFVLEDYLTSYAAFVYLDGNDNPPVYAYFDDYGDKSCESFLWHNSIEDFLIYQHKRYYEAFLERLAGRTELQARVENAKAIFKPLREKARKLLTSAPELQEIQSVRLGLKWLQWAHKELFYNVYNLRYHSDFSLWHNEMLDNNNLILKYLAKARPHIAAINPLYSQIVDELEIGFTNFTMRINEIAGSPDATVRQLSQAAKNAANEQRDITDFLI